MANDAYKKMAEQTVAALHVKCTGGHYSERLFRRVLVGPDSLYPLEILEWMRKFLDDPNPSIAASCLECLCAHGARIGDFHELICRRFADRIFGNRVIEIAERQRDPDTLSLFLEENSGYMNRAIIALKKTGNETYLTSLMFSNDDSFVKAVRRIASNDSDGTPPPGADPPLL